MASGVADALQPKVQDTGTDATKKIKNRTPQYIEVDCLKRSDIATLKKSSTATVLQHNEGTTPGKCRDSKKAPKFIIVANEKSEVHEYEEVDPEEEAKEEKDVSKPASPKPAPEKVRYENLVIADNEKSGRGLCTKQCLPVLFIVVLVILVCVGFAVISLELYEVNAQLSSYQQDEDPSEMQLQGCVELQNDTEFLSQFMYNGTSILDLFITLHGDLSGSVADVERLNQTYLRSYAALKEMLVFSSNQLTHFNQNVLANFSDINRTLDMLKLDFGVLNRSFAAVSDLYNQVLHTLNNLGEPPSPGTSCASLSSGYYRLRASNGSNVRAYCDMTRSCGGVAGGWTRVAYLQFENGSDPCPNGFKERRNSSIRTCGISSSTAACPSILFDTYGISYSRVCGKVRAYQFGSTDAFRRFDTTLTQNNIDSTYVDGVSLTHGSSPRHHIWTFVSALDEFGYLANNSCPCSNPRLSQVPTPVFVGDNYFCDSGTTSTEESRNFYGTDPLWDGAGCGPTSTCCSFNNPPWFHKQLPQPTTDDIEMRVCSDEDRANEDIRIASVEIYVQ